MFAEASTHSGISAGVIKAAWDAAGEVISYQVTLNVCGHVKPERVQKKRGILHGCLSFS